MSETRGLGAPFGWRAIRIEKGSESASFPPFDGDAAPMRGAHARLVATGDRGEVVTEGAIAEVVDDNRAIVELIYVADETLRGPYPLLVLLARSASSEPWTIEHWESTLSPGQIDARFEGVRAVIVRERALYLKRKTEEPLSRFEAMLRSEAELAEMRAALERIRTWHRDTKRTWPLETQEDAQGS
jgi:hypothetical protein